MYYFNNNRQIIIITHDEFCNFWDFENVSRVWLRSTDQDQDLVNFESKGVASESKPHIKIYFLLNGED